MEEISSIFQREQPMNDILGVLVTLLFVGYTALEVGRFRKARDLGQEPAWYRWLRVSDRIAMGVVVLAMAWSWLEWDSLGSKLPDTPTLVAAALALLMILLVVDFVGLLIQYRRERRRRERHFLSEMERIVGEVTNGDSDSKSPR